MHAPMIAESASALITAVGGLIALIIVFLVVKIVLRLAWRLLSIGCFLILILLLAAAVATHFAH